MARIGSDGDHPPTYAGNTKQEYFRFMKTMDHPRLRGEHRWQGSRWRADKGITPAYAGNTKYQVAEVDGFADHPRLRGEHLLYLFAIDIFWGSPPPTRGTLSKQSDIKL